MKNSIDAYETFEGIRLLDEVTIPLAGASFALAGTNVRTGESAIIPISPSLLSKHILLLGGIGMGKTNTFNHLVRNIRQNITEKDVVIIFDPKGDYYKKFYTAGDIVISNDDRATDYWNIFNEVTIDERVEENINEIATFLFKEKIKNSSNPFFPSAAKDIFAGLISYIIRRDLDMCKNNRSLRKNIDNKTAKDYVSLFSKYADMKGICSYIGADAAGQTQGVISEFQQAVREVFIGNFAKKGDFSIRQAVKNKGKKVIFIEYDLSLGKTLAPIYSLLIDLAIKQALCNREGEGNVYFVMDEFRLLSPLDHMDNGINFGRSLGAKFILGLQNVEQIYDVYGELAGRSILSGCSTLISFFVSDAESRRLIADRSGGNLKKLTYMSAVATKGVSEQIMNGRTIEDWDIGKLSVGEAIVQYLNYPPFRFKFNEYIW